MVVCRGGWRGGGGGVTTMPPDLIPETTPIAGNPFRSNEDADARGLPPPHGTADHTSSSNDRGLQQLARENAASTSSSDTCRVGQVGSGTEIKAGMGTRGAAPSAPPVVNKYRLVSELRAVFASVGATDSAYSFREVLWLLKTYLFSNVSLFDPNDKLYINCESDPLGKVLGVKRFHFNDVKDLISHNIIKVHPARDYTCQQPTPSVPDSVSSSISTGGSNDSTCRLSVPVGAAPSIPGGGTVTSQGAPNLESVSATSPGPGSSRVCDRKHSVVGTSHSPPSIFWPDIPESCSDTETVYSAQDYETEYCRNTEFEISEEEMFVDVNNEVYEEFEPPSDDARDDDKEQSSDDGSSIDDVDIAVLAYTVLQDKLEQGFWADDDSDLDSEISDEDNDPECGLDRWDCLTCGLKNKPFVRYCGKCWQLRKNWLPDRPKRRKRKPRPKKRNLKKKMASGPSEEPSSAQGTSYWKDHTTEDVSESSTDDNSQGDELIRTSSKSTTASSSSTQDTGFCSSQDLLESQDVIEEVAKDPCVEEKTLSPESISKEPTESEKQTLEDKVQPKMLSSRKRKSSSSEYFTTSKRSKGTQDNTEVPLRDPEVIAEESASYLSSSGGKAWLSSPDGLKFARFLKSTQGYQEFATRIIAEQTSSSSSGSAWSTSTCSICCLRPKNATIIHGKLAHVATCYKCAKRLFNEGARCPVCRRKIHMVCKQIIA